MSQTQQQASFGDVCSILRDIRSAVHSRSADAPAENGLDESQYAIVLLDRLETGSWWKDIPRRT